MINGLQYFYFIEDVLFVFEQVCKNCNIFEEISLKYYNVNYYNITNMYIL